MASRVRLTLVVLAGALLAGCKDNSSPDHTAVRLTIVSGEGQSGAPSSALTLPLVVRALDASNNGVAGVPITWTVTGGGSVSPASGTTASDGTDTVTWTLSATTGAQIATATTTDIQGGGAASFLADNGLTITGTVTLAPNASPFAASFSRSPGRAARLVSRSSTPHVSPNRIIIGFRASALGVAAAGTGASRSLSVARSGASRMQTRLASLMATRPISHAELSPAMLAARVRVDDTLHIDAVMASLRNDSSVAWVERDEVVSIRDGAPRPMSAAFIRALAAHHTVGTASTATNIPNDPQFFAQYWPANMVDLPRAWSITTGSPAVTVAVVDMGIRFEHPDVAPNITQDGYDFVSQVGFGTTETLCDGTTFTTIDGDGDGPDPDPTDPDDLLFDPVNGCWVHNDLGDHGLWTAGLIGAVGNEGKGIAGVDWNVRIRPVRVLGITGEGTNFDIAQGVLYAAGLPATGQNGALVQAPSASQIINMSLGGTSPSSTLASAVQAAQDAGSLVVASAGNEGFDIPVYPAALPGVIAVAAVGEDGALATYSNAGTYISVAAPGGDFRLDDNGGGGVLGPGWDFTVGAPTYLFGYGTSAAAPYVSGVAALLLAKTPGLNAAALRSRIEQYATRPAGTTRSDMFGWGIVNAYDALTQQSGPARAIYARLIDASGLSAGVVKVGSDGHFAFTQLAPGSYYMQAGEDEADDANIGVAGRRFNWAGGFGSPTVFTVGAQAQTAAVSLGMPSEVEPNDDLATANRLSVGSYVVGQITTPDTRDVYMVDIPANGTYTFETSGVVGSCGFGIELDTFMSLATSTGSELGANDDAFANPGLFCAKLKASLTPGRYYVTITGSSLNALAFHGRYRLEVRAGS